MESNSNYTPNYAINFVNHCRLFNEIINYGGELLIFDFRPKECFEKSKYIKYSVNFPFNCSKIDFTFCTTYCPDTWQKNYCNSESSKIVMKLKRYYILIVTNNEYISRECLYKNVYGKLRNDKKLTDIEMGVFKGLLMYDTLHKNRIREMGFFLGSYQKFLDDFNFITMYNKIEKFSFNEPYPSTILDYHLFAGDQSHAANLDLLKHFKITHILNVTEHFGNMFEKAGIKYLKIEIDDTHDQNLIDHLDKIFDFIDSALFGENIIPSYSLDNNDENFRKTFQRRGTLSSNKEDYSCNFFKQMKFYEEESLKTEIELISEKLQENHDSYYMLNQLIQSKFKLMIIEKQREMGENINFSNRVLVHCSLGVSRSSAAIMCYIIKKFRLNVDIVSCLMEFWRKKAVPIPKFINELEEYYKRTCNEDI